MADGIRQISRTAVPISGTKGALNSGYGSSTGFTTSGDLLSNYTLLTVNEFTQQGVQEAVDHAREFGAIRTLNGMVQTIEERREKKWGGQTGEAVAGKEKEAMKEGLDSVFGTGYISPKELDVFAASSNHEKLLFLREKFDVRLKDVEADIPAFIKATDPTRGFSGLFASKPAPNALTDDQFKAVIAKMDPAVREAMQAMGTEIVISDKPLGQVVGSQYNDSAALSAVHR